MRTSSSSQSPAAGRGIARAASISRWRMPPLAVVDGRRRWARERRCPPTRAGADQVVAVEHPDVAEDAARRAAPACSHCRVQAVTTRVELTTTVSLKANKRGGDADAGDDQRREDLVRRKARRLHRHDLAVLVEAGEGDQRAEQHREGQEARDQHRQAQADIAPQLGVAVAGDGEDLAGFAEQVERHQDQHQRDQHGEAAREEQPHHVEGEPPRREEAEVDHALSASRALRASAPRMRLATLGEEPFERADRLAAGLVGEDVVHPARSAPASSTSGTHSAEHRVEPAAARRPARHIG